MPKKNEMARELDAFRTEVRREFDWLRTALQSEVRLAHLELLNKLRSDVLPDARR